jgi:hypothetical protein
MKVFQGVFLMERGASLGGSPRASLWGLSISTSYLEQVDNQAKGAKLWKV